MSSVSRILRGGQGHVYPPETYQRVEEAAKRLGYQANAAARLLSQRKPTMIGMSVHFTEHPYLNRFLRSVHEELLKHEYDPVFLDAQQIGSESSIQIFPPPQMLAGLISMAIDLQKSWPPYYADLCQRIPIVSVQPVFPEAAKWVDVIQVDFDNAYQQVCQHLIQLGHRNIAFLNTNISDNAFPSDVCKLQGWKKAARFHNIAPENQILWKMRPSPDPKLEGGPAHPKDFIFQPETQQSLIDVVKQLEALPQRITALVCFSDEIAIGLQSYLQSQGWKLPRDLSIIGYDGISMGGYVYPALTTIEPDYDRMAAAAVCRLLELIESPNKGIGHEPQQICIEPKLLVRASTAPPSAV